MLSFVIIQQIRNKPKIAYFYADRIFQVQVLEIQFVRKESREWKQISKRRARVNLRIEFN